MSRSSKASPCAMSFPSFAKALSEGPIPHSTDRKTASGSQGDACSHRPSQFQPFACYTSFLPIQLPFWILVSSLMKVKSCTHWEIRALALALPVIPREHLQKPLAPTAPVVLGSALRDHVKSPGKAQVALAILHAHLNAYLALSCLLALLRGVAGAESHANIVGGRSHYKN